MEQVPFCRTRIKLHKLEEKERKPPQNDNSPKLYIAQCNPCGADPPPSKSEFRLPTEASPLPAWWPSNWHAAISWFFSSFWPSNSDLRNISSPDFGLVNLLHGPVSQFFVIDLFSFSGNPNVLLWSTFGILVRLVLLLYKKCNKNCSWFVIVMTPQVDVTCLL